MASSFTRCVPPVVEKMRRKRVPGAGSAISKADDTEEGMPTDDAADDAAKSPAGDGSVSSGGK